MHDGVEQNLTVCSLFCLFCCTLSTKVLLNVALQDNDEDLRGTAIASLVHFGSRVVHLVAYIAGLDYTRLVAFLVGAVANFVNYGLAFDAANL